MNDNHWGVTVSPHTHTHTRMQAGTHTHTHTHTHTQLPRRVSHLSVGKAVQHSDHKSLKRDDRCVTHYAWRRRPHDLAVDVRSGGCGGGLPGRSWAWGWRSSWRSDQSPSCIRPAARWTPPRGRPAGRTGSAWRAASWRTQPDRGLTHTQHLNPPSVVYSSSSSSSSSIVVVVV